MRDIEGYKTFSGTMRITPINAKFKPFELYGDWVYNPETECWYGDGQSFPVEICAIIKEDE